MTASAHLAVGAAAGLLTQRFLFPDVGTPEKLFIAFAAGVVSHVVLDAIPHQEYEINGLPLFVTLLLEVYLVFLFTLSSGNSMLLNSVIFLGMVGGAFPDVIELTYDHIFSWPWLSELGRVIHFFHYKRPSSFVLSFYLQEAIAIVSIVLVRLKSTP